MVQALHVAGLRVGMDVVYNHTTASGQSPRSLLDRIVPGYYQRLDASGAVETSTCCQNVATEHAMAEQLMVDSTVLWARDYKVDGFRFDLMGHHSRDNMLAVREALDALPSSIPMPAPFAPGVTAQMFGTGPTSRGNAMSDMFVATMYAARAELLVTTPYFVPDEAQLRALCAATPVVVMVNRVVPWQPPSMPAAVGSIKMARSAPNQPG